MKTAAFADVPDTKEGDAMQRDRGKPNMTKTRQKAMLLISALWDDLDGLLLVHTHVNTYLRGHRDTSYCS